MPSSSDELDSWVDDTERSEERGAAPRQPGRGADPALITGDLDGARGALEKAQDAYDTAHDVLADLEGRLVVLEGQDNVGEHREAAEAAVADLEGRIAVARKKAAAIEADETKEPWQQAAALEDVAKAERALALTQKKLTRAEKKLESEAREELARAKRAFIRAGRKLARVEAELAAAAERVEAEEQAIRAALVGAPGATGEVQEPEPPRFATVELFVEEFVLPNWVHKFQRVGWCDRWWEHAEAITRFEAMWEAFEVMRREPAPSFSTWLRDHFDVHMRTLLDPDGVFFNCDASEGFHEPAAPWKHQAAPEGMFATIESAQVQRSGARGNGTGQPVATTGLTGTDQSGGGHSSAEAMPPNHTTSVNHTTNLNTPRPSGATR